MPRAVPEVVEAAEQVEIGDEPGQLLDMRLVMARGARPGETYRQRELREYYKANRRDFMAEASKLERELIAARAKVSVSPAVGDGPRVVDAGSGQAVGALEKWLEGFDGAG